MSRYLLTVALSSNLALTALLPCLGQEQQFIMRPSAPALPPAAVKAPGRVKSSPTALLPFSSLIEHQLPPVKKHLPLEKIVISTDLAFEPSKDRLTEAGEARLKTLTTTFRRLKSHPVTIVGHTDSFGFEADNVDLTLHQAMRIKSWLVAHGLAKAVAVTTSGAGSASPIAAENHLGGKEAVAIRARNRRIEITIDPNKGIEADVPVPPVAVVAPKVESEANEVKAMDLPEGLDDSLVDGETMMKPVTEEDLNPNFVPDNGDGGAKSAHHKVNEGEWGRGGSDFGNNLSSFGQMAAGAQPEPQYNNEGKRVVQVTPSTADLEQRRKETVEAQNEFGLWRDP